MVNLLKNIWAKLIKPKPKSLFPDIVYPIKEAFTLNGVVYYSFGLEKDAAFNIPYSRAFKTITFYTEMASRIDDAYLAEHIALSDAIFKSQHIDIFKLQRLNEHLKQRREFRLDDDLIYKLASVVYFDENEDPREYDPAYNRKKIDIWKKSLNVNDFFYSAPILNLIPFLKDSDINLVEYFKVEALVKEEHLKYISANK